MSHQPANVARSCSPLLVRRGTDSRNRAAISSLHEREIAGDEYFRMAGYREIRIHKNPPDAIDRSAEFLSERRGSISGRPEHRAGRNSFVAYIDSTLLDASDDRVGT